MTIYTPFFPCLRARLAALGQRTVQSLRQLDFPPLAQKLRDLLPSQLLASEDEGPGSRDRIYSLRLTFECFVCQMLKRQTACREVVRAVQALFQSVDKGLAWAAALFSKPSWITGKTMISGSCIGPQSLTRRRS